MNREQVVRAAADAGFVSVETVTGLVSLGEWQPYGVESDGREIPVSFELDAESAKIREVPKLLADRRGSYLPFLVEEVRGTAQTLLGCWALKKG